MEIKKILKENRFCLSFEVFPPKREGNLESLFSTIGELGTFDPHFISVTYGAGGSTRDKTLEIASKVKNDFQREVLGHLTCVEATRDDIARTLDAFRERNIENILALRGDPPAGQETFTPTPGGFHFASDLVEFIHRGWPFCIGVAGYPEGHPEAASFDDDLKNLKKKIDAGADFIVTQLFFNNEFFFRFRDRARAMKIQVPILPGLWPILNYNQIKRIVGLCGATIPSGLGDKLDRVMERPGEVEKYGLEHAVRQAEELIRSGVDGLHIYCMNRSEPVRAILGAVSIPRGSAEQPGAAEAGRIRS